MVRVTDREESPRKGHGLDTKRSQGDNSVTLFNLERTFVI